LANVLLPPPFKGENNQFPLISIQSPYCERMENFNNLDGSVKLRLGNGITAHTTIANYKIYGVANYGTTALFVLALDAGTSWRLYNITTGSFVLLANLASTGLNPATFFFFDNLIFSVGATGQTLLFDGSTATASPYTFASIAPYGGTEFKSRAYFIGYNSTKYAYGGIEAIAGATTEVNLGGQLTSKAVMYMIRPISMTQNLTAESALAFIFSSGEILVYTGSYPDSDNWSRVSRFKVSKPIEYNAYVEAKGDSFLFTQSEVLSLRNLFVSGYDTERDEGIGATINKRWRQCMKAYIAQGTIYKYIKGVYDEANDRIVICMPKYVNPDTGAIVEDTLFQLIYDFNLEAWYEYIQTDDKIEVGTGATYYNDAVYLAVQVNTSGTEMYVLKMEQETNHLDRNLDGSGTTPIDYKLRTAHYPVNKSRSSCNNDIIISSSKI